MLRTNKWQSVAAIVSAVILSGFFTARSAGVAQSGDVVSLSEYTICNISTEAGKLSCLLP